MNPFAQLIAPQAFTRRRLPATGAVLTVREGVALVPPGRGRGRHVPDKLARLPVFDADDAADAEALRTQLMRERQRRWYADRYARQKQDPAYMAARRERNRLLYQRPDQKKRKKRWEAENADALRACKTQWAQMQRANETPEERAARLAESRVKQREYYAKNREVLLEKQRLKREAKRAEKKAAMAGGAAS